MSQELVQTILSIISDQDLLVKGVLILTLALYNLFALIILRQIVILTSIVNQFSSSFIIKTFVYTHAFASLSLLVFVILVV